VLYLLASSPRFNLTFEDNSFARADLTPAVEMRKIVKRFPGVVANDRVDFAIATGEIHALLGENGAGKSTLMQVLYGFHRKDSGEILIDGSVVRIEKPSDAIALGIGMVHQEFMLVSTMTVVENTVLGLRATSGTRFDLVQASERLRELSQRHHLEIDPQSVVGELSIGVQQRVEILKLLYRDARVLILDEPTAVLTVPEKERLFAVLQELRAEGKSIVIVTHKLHEIMALADRVTIMRDGAVVASMATSETTREELAHRMVGREVHLQVTKSSLRRGAPVLEIRDLRVRDEAGHLRVNGVTLDVHAGEIVGIAGVDGNGQSQLAEAMLQLRPIAGGNVLLKGEVASSRAASVKHISYVPADRRGVGAVMELSLAENAILGSQRRWLQGPFLDRSKIELHAQMLIQRFGVRGGGIDARVSKLSGGNLQKLILGREILRGAEAMVIEQPTRGLDAGAVETIWQELLLERERGTAILLISAELEELMNLADRIAVMFEGRIVGIVDAATTTMEALGMMMVGGNSADASVAR
jgi:ABC-type uncharacterized transport system ATPase subunit